MLHYVFDLNVNRFVSVKILLPQSSLGTIYIYCTVYSNLYAAECQCPLLTSLSFFLFFLETHL